MLNAQAFLPRVTGRQVMRSALGAKTCNLALLSPFLDRQWRERLTGTGGSMSPRLFLWLYQGELKAKFSGK